MAFVQSLIHFFTSNLIAILALWMGVSFDKYEVRKVLSHRVVIRALILSLLIVPVIGIVVAKVFPLRPVASGLIVLMAISPGVPLLTIGTLTRKYLSTSAAMAVSVMLTLASIISVPIWTAILGLVFPTKLEASPFTVFSVVFPKIAIPFFLGWALREFAPVVAKRIEPYVGKVFWGLIALVLVGLILTSYRLVGQIHFVGFAAMVVVILASAFAGDLMGRPKLEDRMLLGSAAIYGNPAVALAIAHVNFPSLKLGPAVAVYILLRVVTFRPYILWMNYEYEHRPARLA